MPHQRAGSALYPTSESTSRGLGSDGVGCTVFERARCCRYRLAAYSTGSCLSTGEHDTGKYAFSCSLVVL